MPSVQLANVGQGQGNETKYIVSYRWRFAPSQVIRGNALITAHPVLKLIETNALPEFQGRPVELLWFEQVDPKIAKPLAEFQTYATED